MKIWLAQTSTSEWLFPHVCVTPVKLNALMTKIHWEIVPLIFTFTRSLRIIYLEIALVQTFIWARGILAPLLTHWAGIIFQPRWMVAQECHIVFENMNIRVAHFQFSMFHKAKVNTTHFRKVSNWASVSFRELCAMHNSFVCLEKKEGKTYK